MWKCENVEVCPKGPAGKCENLSASRIFWTGRCEEMMNNISK